MATTNVPSPTFGARGFEIPPAQEVLTGVLEDVDAAFGGGMNMQLSTPQGQLASSEAAVVDNTNAQFLFLTQMFDPAYAFGRYQDALARIYFIQRNPAQPTVVEAICTGLAGVEIPVNSLAVAADGTRYISMQDAVIPVGGQVSVQFASTIPGPIPCPAGTLDQIYRSIPGWDSITNPADGVLGNNVESREAFEARRAASVALNSIGSLPSVLGSVLAIRDVIDAFVTENTSNSPATIGGVSLLPNSLYVAVVGGEAQAIGEAIWRKKAPGCAYNGNTNVTVLDTSDGYVPPYPAYSVSFERPDALGIVFDIVINDTPQVPADAEELIQGAIIGAFAGLDGGQRTKIGTNVFASRYYCAIAALGPWAQIVTLKIGSTNDEAAEFTAAIAGTAMTVSAVASGTLAVGQTLFDASGDLMSGTKIVSQSSGTPGGTGVYVVSNSQTVGSETMLSVVADLNEIVVNIDQIPVTSASLITVTLS